LHKARARRSSISGCARANSSSLKSPTNSNTVTSLERRETYLRRLHDIWPDHDSHSDDPRAASSPYPIVSVDRPPPPVVPCVYTSPMECPLSLLSFVSESVCAIQSQTTRPSPNNVPSQTSTSKSTHPGTLVPCNRELMVEVHSAAEHELRLPVALSSCPSLSDTHQSFPGVESPQAPTFPLFSPSLSPSSCSTISANGGVVSGFISRFSGPNARTSVSSRSGTKTKELSQGRTTKSKDTVSYSSSSSSSRSSSGHPKRPSGSRGGRQTSSKKQSSQPQSLRKREANSTQSISANTVLKGAVSEVVRTGDRDENRRRRTRAPKLQSPQSLSGDPANSRPSTWEQLRVVVRDSDAASLPDATEGSIIFFSPQRVHRLRLISSGSHYWKIDSTNEIDPVKSEANTKKEYNGVTC
uniref:Pecanex-like protein n=1 Tax=Echinostoma caproni TaxID=27848 RepID=A0A183AY08_9TREM